MHEPWDTLIFATVLHNGTTSLATFVLTALSGHFVVLFMKTSRDAVACRSKKEYGEEESDQF